MVFYFAYCEAGFDAVYIQDSKSKPDRAANRTCGISDVVSEHSWVCRFGGKVPRPIPGRGTDIAEELGGQVQPLVQQYIELLEKIKIREAIRIALVVSSLGNKLFQVSPGLAVWGAGLSLAPTPPQCFSRLQTAEKMAH